jgi:methionine-rich copper-binding protein CopC
MNVYQQLVTLATEPSFAHSDLINNNGDTLKSAKSVLEELSLEINSDITSDAQTIDIRQACETRVSDR